MSTRESIIYESTEFYPRQGLLRTDPNSDILPLIQEAEDIFQQQETPCTALDLIKQPDSEQWDQTISKDRVGICRRLGAKATVQAQASAEDWRQSDKKSRLITSWLGYGAVKIIGRFHLPTVVVSYASMDVLAATGSTPLTALTAMAACTAWSRLATGTMNDAVDHNPRAFLTAGGQLSLSRHWADALPGLRSYIRAEGSETGRKDSSRTARVLTHIKRGAVATTKLTPYISAAGREGQTRIERRKLAWALSMDAGLIEAAMFAGIAQTIKTVAGHNPNLAESIQQGIKNPLLWSAAGSIMMAGEFTKNKLSKHRAARKTIENEGSQLSPGGSIPPVPSNDRQLVTQNQAPKV